MTTEAISRIINGGMPRRKDGETLDQLLARQKRYSELVIAGRRNARTLVRGY